MSWQTKSSIPVEEYTTPSPITGSPEDSYQSLLEKMREGGFRHLPIVSEEEVVGLVSERDLKLLEGLGSLSESLKAQDFMRRDVYMTDPKTSLEKVVFEMSRRKIGSAIIRDESEDFLGMFTSTDALNALVDILRGDVDGESVNS